jgi:hypothetical protein
MSPATKIFSQHEFECLLCFATMVVIALLFKWIEVLATKKNKTALLRTVMWMCSTAALIGAGIMFVAMVISGVYEFIVNLFPLAQNRGLIKPQEGK